MLRPHAAYEAAYLDDAAVLESRWRAGFMANPKKCAVGLGEVRYRAGGRAEMHETHSVPVTVLLCLSSLSNKRGLNPEQRAWCSL